MYRFEIVHLFDDGNGAVGRMAITLFLNVKYLNGVLQRPMFYMSRYLKNNRTQHRMSLKMVNVRNIL
jgi:Fic family protein